MKHEDFPYATSFVDAAGKTRWRVRRKGQKPRYLRGAPGSIEFAADYAAIVEGRPLTDRRTISRREPEQPIERDPANVVRMAERESFADAWRLLRARPKWQSLDLKTRQNQGSAIEHFLCMNVAAGEPEQWRDMPVAALKSRHVEDILERVAVKTTDERGRLVNGPAKAKAVKIGIRKLIKEARRHDWVDFNVATDLDWSEPQSAGWLPWTENDCAKFEARHPIGSQARTTYELARWLGNRRADVALLRWTMIETRVMIVDGHKRQVTGFAFTQHKNRVRKPVDVFLPITPMLAQALAPLDRSTETVLATKQGEPYEIRSLSRMMKDWTTQAGIARPKLSMHGLRKVLGAMLDDAEASSGQNQDVLGHASSAVNDGYRKSRNRARNAVRGMDKVVQLFADREAS